MAVENNQNLFSALTQLGDDALILSQRLCEWSGHAPTLELDISLSNLALDLVGQATLLLNYAGEVEGTGRNGDTLAYRRDHNEFSNCLIVEQPNGDFGQTVLRHFFYSAYALPIYQGLARSTDEHLAAIAEKAVKELRYHFEYSSGWVIRLGDGTEESRNRMLKALDWLWRFIDDMFVEDSAWSDLVDANVVPSRKGLREEFDATVLDVLSRAGLELPAQVWPITGGREGRHSEHLSLLLAEMQVLSRAHPEAAW